MDTPATYYGGKQRLTHGSLFTGFCGFDFVAEFAGFTNLFNCEIDPFCRKLAAYYFPDAISYEDIKTTDFTRWRGKVDVLTGGFPCQPFSTAGRRKGTEDDRYLWPEMLRVVREIRPTWVIGENVAGLTSMVQFSDDVKVEDCTDLFGERYTIETMEGPYVLDRICEDLEQSGYEVQPFVVPACAVGAPHRRDRVWIVAHSEGDGGSGAPVETSGASWRQDGNEVEQPIVWGEIRVTSNAVGAGLQAPRSELATAGVTGDGAREDATNAERGDRGGTRQKEPSRRAGFTGSGKREHPWRNIPGWEQFPTQSPVCSRDNGLSLGLDGITFSDWRTGSLRGFGNAIVPQVALEFFKAIIHVESELAQR